jgi:hypothetical protein
MFQRLERGVQEGCAAGLERAPLGPFFNLWPNTAFANSSGPLKMGNKIVTEADRKATPRPATLPGFTLPTGGRGQKVSLERGVSTRSKKNPGKRSKKGG